MTAVGAGTARRIRAYRNAFGTPTRIHVHDLQAATMFAVNENADTPSAAIAVFKVLNVTKDNWAGYAAGGFIGGQGLPVRWRLTFNGDPLRYLTVAVDRANTAYVNAFTGGETVHPIHTFTIPAWRMELLIAVMEMESAAGEHYPPFDDLPVGKGVYGRWKQYRVIPKGIVNLRCVPTTENNAPTGTLKAPLSAYVIPNAFAGADGAWAQMIVGGVRYWVSQSLIELT